VVCRRIREQVSLQLDGELSALEQRMLDSHLSRCGACRQYAARVAEFTTLVREAPLVPLPRPVVVSRARRISLAHIQVGVAAAFALAALGIGVQLSSSASGSELSGPITRYPTQAEFERELELLAQLTDRERPVSASAVVL
jgi:predicted anti-sigma-YlaC factor YlaD